MMFANRNDAGRQLGALLRTHGLRDPVVVGLSRGGVPVAAEVARILDAPLEVCVVRKLLAPGAPSITIGAVAERGATYVDAATVAHLGLAAEAVATMVDRETAEVTRLGNLLRDGPPLDIRTRNVIVVDDGVVTAHTIRAAADSLRGLAPRRLILAVPTGAAEVVDSLRADFDDVIVLDPEPLAVAIGARYLEFWPVSEAEVAGVLAAAHR